MEERYELIENIKEHGITHDIYIFMLEHEPGFLEFVENAEIEHD